MRRTVLTQRVSTRGLSVPYLGRAGRGPGAGTPGDSYNGARPGCSHRSGCSDTHPTAPRTRPRLGRQGCGQRWGRAPPLPLGDTACLPTSGPQPCPLPQLWCPPVECQCLQPPLPIRPASDSKKVLGPKRKQGLKRWALEAESRVWAKLCPISGSLSK